MCLATVYVEKDGREQELMRDVAWIRLEGSGLQLITFLGESEHLQATIRSIDLLNGSVVLAMTAESSQVAEGLHADR